MTEHNRKESILLVDDDVELLKALTKVLEKEGYEISPHADAVSALETLTRGDHRFDLVLTDVAMPGMHGAEFIAAIRRYAPSLPVIIITAYGDAEPEVDVLRSSSDEFLHKPIEKTELLVAVRHALQSHPTGAN